MRIGSIAAGFCLILGTPMLASSPGALAPGTSCNPIFGPEIRLDTKGVEFGLWIRPFIATLKRQWVVPKTAMPVKGHVVITFDVQKDGTITDVKVRIHAPLSDFDTSARNAIIGSG